MSVHSGVESDTSPRGSVMMNSVNSPGSVSTSIRPPCCLTTMSWLIDSPRPVPSPAGLVVKKGLKIFALTSGGMPVPLSRMRISILLPRFLVAALTAGSKLPSALSDLRLVAAQIPLEIRLRSTRVPLLL
jgi:hypothetical protein